MDSSSLGRRPPSSRTRRNQYDAAGALNLRTTTQRRHSLQSYRLASTWSIMCKYDVIHKAGTAHPIATPLDGDWTTAVGNIHNNLVKTEHVWFRRCARGPTNTDTQTTRITILRPATRRSNDKVLSKKVTNQHVDYTTCLLSKVRSSNTTGTRILSPPAEPQRDRATPHLLSPPPPPTLPPLPHVDGGGGDDGFAIVTPPPPDDVGSSILRPVKIKKVKFSHTRYRALGPELIPVYRQSARRWREVNHAIDPAVGCHYFLPGLRLPP